MADTMIRLEYALRRRQRQETIRQILHITGVVALVAAVIYFCWWK